MKTIAMVLAGLVMLGGCRGSEPAALTARAGATTEAADHVTVGAGDLAGFSLYDIGSTWRDQRGDAITLAGLAGTIRVVALVYTSCHGTCPAIVVDMKRLEAALPPGRTSDVGFVLISLDPARDTPGRLSAWAADTRLDPARWTLLNGSDAAVREIAATLGVRYQQQPDGEIAHTNVITVLDGTGAVVHQQAALGDAVHQTSRIVNELLTSTPATPDE